MGNGYNLILLHNQFYQHNMIKKLNHKSHNVAQNIFHVFQKSYAVEAKILNAKDFPPLKRTVEQFLQAKTLFLGYLIDGYISAVIELDIHKNSIHIQSLVVHPNYFKQGIAIKLLNYVFEFYKSKCYTVETGADNIPAINLYKKLGFAEVGYYDTDHGIRKIRLNM